MAELPELTDRQRQVYEFIRDRIRTLGYSPTIREIGRHLGIRSTNGVADHLKALKRKGYLVQEDMKSRTLRPTEPITPLSGGSAYAAANDAGAGASRGSSAAQRARIPLLGRVAAGEPILAEEHAEGMLDVDPTMLGVGGDVFALRVVGNSMINDGILDGDTVFVQKRNHADQGDIVVVVIDNEATVKRFYQESGRVRLQPSNDAMDPIVLGASDFKAVEIAGVVVGVYRRIAA